MTITDALETLIETIREIEKECEKSIEEIGIYDDEDLITFALNYLNSNACDIFYDLLESENEK